MNHLEILRYYGIRAQKSLGQNFLVNDEILERIADSIEITGKDILEIGPGYGALTEKILARKPKSLTLIELDKNMVHILKSRIAEKDLIIPPETTFQIVEGDVLKYIPSPHPNPLLKGEGIKESVSPLLLGEGSGVRGKGGILKYVPDLSDRDVPRHVSTGYSIIANIPYYITSPILFRFLHELEHKPDEMVILMQKEVGDKICEKKGYHHSYLSLALQYSCETIEEICPVLKENFIPAPKVDSSVLYFKRKQEYDAPDAKRFLNITSAGFSAPRKKVLSNLTNALHLPKEALSKIFHDLELLETARAEELDFRKWTEIIEKIGK
ncbi:MAG: rRNA adenine dimethyltransferase family protein [Candidatus Gracilibacteria bacterium]|nr:rRNA adenine dimethyltransferase family protein [Candidatus Gracilibacteria bacterium]